MMRSAPHTLPPSSSAPSVESDSQTIADFVLYDQQNDDLYFRTQHFHSHPYPESISPAEHFSAATVASRNHFSTISPSSYTAMLGGESTAEDLHSHHQTVSEASHKAFYSLSPVSQALAGEMSTATSAPPFDFIFHGYSASEIPRSISMYEDHNTAPDIMINPPTFSYASTSHSSHLGQREYRSTTASPATSAGGAFEAHSSISGHSGSESGSIIGSPFNPTMGVEENLQELAFNTAFVDPTIDPNLIHHSPQQLEPEPLMGSPTWTATHSPPPNSNPSSPEMGRRRHTLSPYTQHTHRVAPYPQGSRRPSLSSVKSRSSGRGSPSGFPIDFNEEIYTSEMMREQPQRASSMESHQTRGGRATSTAGSAHGGHGNVSSSNTVTKDSVCPECGKSFRDLRAHQLTHQLERPEKCPISTCEYSKKGFARKYDCQRHTLTHYKGTMVCGFCPGSGSAVEKSFNRADVFKRHLMAVHNVEQTPPNGRKKASKGGSVATPIDGERYSNGSYATGKCSTCSVTFATAQQFYEHLDECVLSKVVQEEPTSAFNEMNLDQVKMEDMEAASTNAARAGSKRAARTAEDDEEDDAEDDDEFLDAEEADDAGDDAKDGTFTASTSRKSCRTARTPSTRSKTAAKGASGSTKRGASSSSGGGGSTILLGGGPRGINKALNKNKSRRKKRKNLPAGWGCAAEQMVTKRRCLMVFDGPRTLCRDEMMMSTEFEVKAQLGGDTFVSDLDFWTMRRAEAFLDAAPSRGAESVF
ncbi:hypothetical protein RUND412_003553 [Rhizina undulata]